jgi:hypothetical protein
MTIRACRECNKDISTEARICPSCGVPDPIYKSPEFIESKKNLNETFGMFIIANIIGNLLLSWLESGFFYWMAIILIFFVTFGFVAMIFDASDKYKQLAVDCGHKYTLAKVYKIIAALFLLSYIGNVVYILTH